MDFVLVLIVTFFAAVIGGLLWYGSKGAERPDLSAVDGFDVTKMPPEQLVEIQLNEILQTKYEEERAAAGAKPEAEAKSSWTNASVAPSIKQGDFPDRETYEALKASADPRSPESAHQLLQALMKRAETFVAQCVAAEENHKIIIDSFNEMVPRNVIQYLNELNGRVEEEMKLIKSEAEELKKGLGEHVIPMAYQRTIGLVKAKQQRAQEEQQKKAEKERQERAEADKKRQQETAAERQQREADRAFQQLMREEAGAKKPAGSPSKDASSLKRRNK